MTFSPKQQQQQTLSDWPRTPLSSRISGMGAIIPSEWGSTIQSYEFELSSFQDESTNILSDIPSVFDTPFQYQSNTNDNSVSQNTSARTSISPTISNFQLTNDNNIPNYTNLAKEYERELTTSVNLSREMSLMPSPSSSNEDGLTFLSSGVPFHSFDGHHEQSHHAIRPRLSQYDLSHLQRRETIIDPLNLIQDTMIPSVILPRSVSPMLPAIVSRMPSPEEEYKTTIISPKRESIYSTSPPLPSVMQFDGHPSYFEPVAGPSNFNSNMPSVFAQPQDPNQFKISTKALEMDGWTSSWSSTEESKGKNKKKDKGKAIQHPNKRDQRQQPPPQPQPTQEGRMFVEIKTQFHTIPENCDQSRFSSNGRCLIACEGCKRRKMRCTNEFPTCSNCSRRGIQCQYAEKVRTRGKAKRTQLFIEKTETLLDNNNNNKRRRISTKSITQSPSPPQQQI